MATTRENRIPIMFSDMEVYAIDKWQRDNRVSTRSKAVRLLCELALKEGLRLPTLVEEFLEKTKAFFDAMPEEVRRDVMARSGVTLPPPAPSAPTLVVDNDPDEVEAGMTVDEALTRATLSVPTAGRLFYGLSRNAAYEAAKRGDFETLRIGGKILVPVAPIAKKLGLPFKHAERA